MGSDPQPVVHVPEELMDAGLIPLCILNIFSKHKHDIVMININLSTLIYFN